MTTVDEKLSVNKYAVDEEVPHIVVVRDADAAEFDKLVTCCPAALYQRDEDGAPTFDYAGCLECGTCRILCGGTIVERWAYPRGSMGVSYRFG
ncbi:MULTISPECIES: ferredoxin family protein [unclassified Adlercreutzia]|uniref:ferredoxin family protein n=1 Tax=unclassified Adlercreutzia TaxID=2636013 RepID=UPI001F1558BE|nr:MULTISPECIES: ferredoxin family protein [unclassified Adlercreutzia]